MIQSCRQLVTSRVSQALILGLIPVHCIWNQQHYKSADEAKLVGEVDKLEVRVTVKTDLNRLSQQELRGVQRRQVQGPTSETESFPATAQAELWPQKPCWKGGDSQQGQRPHTSSNIPETLGSAVHHPLSTLSQAVQNWREYSKEPPILGGGEPDIGRNWICSASVREGLGKSHHWLPKLKRQ